MKRRILTAVAVCLVAAMWVVAARPRSKDMARAGASIEQRTAMPEEIARLLGRGCRNCHSDDTKWPWYSRIPPLSWIIANDVRNARIAMNLSDWPVGQPARAAGTLMAACADVQADRMPLWGYRLMHPESRWSKSEKDSFCKWAREEYRRVLTKK